MQANEMLLGVRMSNPVNGDWCFYLVVWMLPTDLPISSVYRQS